MAEVARRAGSSKETLYAWFGSKQGLLTALIRRQAAAANQAVADALDGDGVGPDPATTLTAFATNLRIDDPGDAFQLQIRVLLGEPPPGPAALADRARVAVDRFLALTAGP